MEKWILDRVLCLYPRGGPDVPGLHEARAFQGSAGGGALYAGGLYEHGCAHLPPAWCCYMYGFFDTLNLRSQLTMGVAPPDDYLYHLNGAGGDLDRLLEKRHHLIGWALVLLGVFAIYNNFVRPWLWNLARLFGYESIFYNVLTSLINGVPNLLVAVALIVVGLWLVKGSEAHAAPAEDFTEFKGAEPKE